MSITVETTDDARRLLAYRAHGCSRVMLLVHALVDDLLGALDAGQTRVAIGVAQDLVVQCALIRSSRVSGQILSSESLWDVGLDPFEGLSDAEAKECATLMERIGAASEDAVPEAAKEILDYAADTEGRLGWSFPLPVIRSPEGIFPALKLARLWAKPLSALALPGVIPKNWLEPETKK